MNYVKHYITIAGEIITPENKRPEDYLDRLSGYLDNDLIGWVPEDWVVLNHGSAPATLEEARQAAVDVEEDVNDRTDLSS